MSNSTGPIGIAPGISIPSATSTGAPAQPSQKRARESGELKHDGLPSRGSGTPTKGTDRPPRRSFKSSEVGKAAGNSPGLPRGYSMPIDANTLAIMQRQEQSAANSMALNEHTAAMLEKQTQSQALLSAAETTAKAAKAAFDALKNNA